jgi:hemolysin activation/secretion protein
MRSKNWTAKTGIQGEIGKGLVTFSASFQSAEILNDTSRYIAKVLKDPNEFRSNKYIGTQATYSYLKVNDSIVPTNGFTFSASAAGYRNMTQNDFFQNYSARAQVYFPLAGKFSLAIRSGVETIVGNSSLVDNAQFYQHAIIGGPVNIRGYRAERFWGKTSFYNQNELRYITDLRTYLLNAKVGILAFFDDGRVWMPKEKSNTIHTSYGGGILVAPFYKISAFIIYGITKEQNLLQFGVNTLL